MLLTGTKLIYARLPVPKTREVAVRRLFENGIAQGQGVLFEKFGDGDGASFCLVWVPSSEREAELALMPRGVKLSVLTDRILVTPVRTSVWWWFLGMLFHRKQGQKELLFR
jgi:hypothetical protein